MPLADTLINDSHSAQEPKPPAEGGGGNPSLSHPDRFTRRHIGPTEAEAQQMLDLLGYRSLDALTDDAVPSQIRLGRPLGLPRGR